MTSCTSCRYLYDWEDLCKRHGTTIIPEEVPKTTTELRQVRFFVNAFVSERAREEENWEEGDWEDGDCEVGVSENE